MISLILYGRNDSYGYNLHKRAALSLNCMAEVLTAPGDEILFVDYNTPDDFPTFPEAIADTLTPRAREMLRTLRVRPKVHEERFAARTHLKALEPVSRNVAARRSNPANRWILSTNTDMIFVPRTGPSLSEAVADLPAGFYCAPRFELPETLWEGFDRLDPRGVIADVRALGARLHLNEIVLGSDLIRYDAPGDFQLIAREDLFAINGFNEEMLLGWHVDSNISKRLKLIHGEVGDAAPFVYGYHCDHTRQVTPAHAHRSAQNDSGRFVDGLTEPGLPYQADWGLASVEIEETRLGASVAGSYRAALEAAIKAPLDAPIISPYRTESYDKVPAPPEHVLPFLLDIFASYPRSTRLLWLGAQGPLLEMFADGWTGMGFAHRVVHRTPVTVGSGDYLRADAFIMNFGDPGRESVNDPEALKDLFLDLVAAEREHLGNRGRPRRIICVNAIHNRFETLAISKLTAAWTPFSTRLRHGFLVPSTQGTTLDLSDKMRAGDAGRRVGSRIEGVGRRGRLAYGPYEILPQGFYIAQLKFDLQPGSPSLREAFRNLLRRSDPSEVKIAVVLNEVEVRSVGIELFQGVSEIDVPFQIDAGEPRMSSSPTARPGVSFPANESFAILEGSIWEYALVWNVDAKVDAPGTIEMEIEVDGSDIGIMCLNADGTEPIGDEIIVASGVSQRIVSRVRRMSEVSALVIRRTSSSEAPTRVKFSRPQIRVEVEQELQIRIDVPAARIDLCRVEIATDTTSDRDGRPRPVRITRQDGSIETL